MTVKCHQRDGGSSHIAPPDMNSYIKKYEFMYPVTYESIHPAQCMNSYVSDPCLVYEQNGHWKRWWGGDGVTATIASVILVPGPNPQNLDSFL